MMSSGCCLFVDFGPAVGGVTIGQLANEVYGSILEFARLNAMATSRSSTESGVSLKLALTRFDVFATTNSWRLSKTSLSSTGGCKLNLFVTCF